METGNKMIVRTIEEYEVIPEGSSIHVDTEIEEWYTGLWSFGCFTVSVFVPKSICEVIEE